ncbi:hypothetical protein GLOIN_2v1762239 [Rhizophagus irregularis DAOM 181602=DAOM 197198]|nr:hypothetical protein GLOIN_2v1762239 [Rhizophagus irregularis DAOM 181602=DAOM 197198]
MTSEFFSKLSQNYIELLDDDSEYYDITIEVEIFQIILRYIYGGILSLDELKTSDILKILVAADELLLQELVGHLQNYLILNESEWIEQHFELTHRTSFKSNNFSELQNYCLNIIADSPEKLFNSTDFTSIPEKLLVPIIKRDDLQMKEVEIWEHVLQWGITQNPTLNADSDTWMDDDFNAMENTLKNCIPLIRFYSLSSKEFLHKVSPYKKLLNHQLYNDLLNSYMDPDYESSYDDNISLPRNIKTDMTIDSKIVNLNIISIVSRWINKLDNNSKFTYLRELYLPYEFKLLLRGSRDGFKPKEFHELCDHKNNTVTFLKIKGTEEIVGGYNPLTWDSVSGWIQTQYSFLFSFKSKSNLENAFLSNVEDIDKAIVCHIGAGPCFGDLKIGSKISLDPSGSLAAGLNFNVVYCKQKYYEKKIRDSEDKFLIEDYEVFQIIKKK